MWDFNDIFDESEKLGGRVRDQQIFNDFRNNIGAVDLDYKGKP